MRHSTRHRDASLLERVILVALAHECSVARDDGCLTAVGELNRSVKVVPGAPLPCHISTDVLLCIGRNTAEPNTEGYQ